MHIDLYMTERDRRVKRLLEFGVVYAAVHAGTAPGYRSSILEAVCLGQKVQGMPTVSIARSG